MAMPAQPGSVPATASEPERPLKQSSDGRIGRWSGGDKHAQAIRIALFAKRLAGKHLRKSIALQGRIVDGKDENGNALDIPWHVRAATAEALVERAAGKAPAAPEDAAAAGAALAAALISIADYMPQLAQMRSAAIAGRVIDVAVQSVAVSETVPAAQQQEMSSDIKDINIA